MSTDPITAGQNELAQDGFRPAAAGLRGKARSLWGVRRVVRLNGVVPEGRMDDVILRRDSLNRRLLAGADVAAAGAALLLGVVLLSGQTLTPWVAVALPLVVFVSKAVGLYDRDQHLLNRMTLDEAPALFEVATFFTLVFWLAEDAVVPAGLPSESVLALWGTLFAALMLARTVARRLARAASPAERCLVVGDAVGARYVLRKLRGCPSLKTEVIGWVPFGLGVHCERRRKARPSTPPILGSMDMLGLILVESDIQRAVIATSTSESEDILEAIRLVKSLGVKVSVLPRLFEVVGSSVEFDDVDGMLLLGVRRHGLSASSQLLKRALDVTGALIGMVLLLPLLVCIALMVKLSSPGPVLFRQVRIGRSGREFVLLKFRTMFEGADGEKDELRARNEADGIFKIAEDPRVTRVGRFLRRTSLDEVPQLINVVRGEMSLVGPRPLVPDEDRKVEGWQRHRLHLAPGMTGLWQIFGSSRIPLGEMVKIDYLYGANWSIWLDCKVLARTFPYAFRRRGL